MEFSIKNEINSFHLCCTQSNSVVKNKLRTKPSLDETFVTATTATSVVPATAAVPWRARNVMAQPSAGRMVSDLGLQVCLLRMFSAFDSGLDLLCLSVHTYCRTST